MRRLGHWLRQTRRLVRRRLGETVHVVASDPPDAPEPRTLYVIGEPNDFWCAVLLCPCGCGQTIRLSLVHGDRPSWTLRLDEADRPTVAPSIHRTVGCTSHFFVRAGRIIWANWREGSPSWTDRLRQKLARAFHR